jgi:hypothetical protein
MECGLTVLTSGSEPPNDVLRWKNREMTVPETAALPSVLLSAAAYRVMMTLRTAWP